MGFRVRRCGATRFRTRTRLVSVWPETVRILFFLVLVLVLVLESPAGIEEEDENEDEEDSIPAVSGQTLVSFD